MTQPESAAPDRRLFGLCLLTLAWSVLVLQAGGFTTSIQAGMAFLEWVMSPAYDPAGIKADFRANMWGSLLTERLLKRE